MAGQLICPNHYQRSHESYPKSFTRAQRNRRAHVEELAQWRARLEMSEFKGYGHDDWRVSRRHCSGRLNFVGRIGAVDAGKLVNHFANQDRGNHHHDDDHRADVDPRHWPCASAFDFGSAQRRAHSSGLGRIAAAEIIDRVAERPIGRLA